MTYSITRLRAAAAITTPAGVSFYSIDIGAVGLEGSYSYNDGKHTISASGRDIGNATDEFNFVYIPITGDVTVIARVSSQQNTMRGQRQES